MQALKKCYSNAATKQERLYKAVSKRVAFRLRCELAGGEIAAHHAQSVCFDSCSHKLIFEIPPSGVLAFLEAS